MKSVSVRLPASLLAQVEESAADFGGTTSSAIRHLITMQLNSEALRLAILQQELEASREETVRAVQSVLLVLFRNLGAFGDDDLQRLAEYLEQSVGR